MRQTQILNQLYKKKPQVDRLSSILITFFQTSIQKGNLGISLKSGMQENFYAMTYSHRPPRRDQIFFGVSRVSVNPRFSGSHI